MLGTNMFFWAWTGAPLAPPPPVIRTTDRGIGHSHKDPTYTPFTEEEWLARETALRAGMPPQPTPETVAEKRLRYVLSLRQYQQHEQQLTAMRAQLDSTLGQLRKSANPDELRQLADTAKQLRIATGTLDNQHRAHLIKLKSMRFQLLN